MSKYTNKKVIEDRKGYNASYYAQNKQQLLNKASKKEECPCCYKMISHVNMPRHLKSKLCKRRCEEQQADEAEFERIEKLEAEREAQYFREKEEDYREQESFNCYVAESDDEDEDEINNDKWELEEIKKQTNDHVDKNYKKVKDSLTDFFKKMEDLQQRKKDNKINDEEFNYIFRGLIEKQSKMKF